jgi:hypothetical protein
VRVDGHELRLFPNCADSLAAAARTLSEIEVVLADWTSDDWPIAEWFDAVMASVSHRVVTLCGDFNRGRGRNRAAEAACGDCLFFVDADCTLNASVLATAKQCVENGMAYFPVVYSYLSPDHTEGWWRHAGYGNCAVSREVFQRTGGWPEYDGWGKEDDVFFRRVTDHVPVVRQETSGFYHQWHPETVLWKDRYTARFPWLVEETTRREAALSQLQTVCDGANTLILVDETRFGEDVLSGHRVWPFLDDHGQFAGPPPDDSTAIHELERMRRSGAQLIAFAWMSFWWLEFYSDFARHLHTNYRRKLATPELMVFDLREKLPSLP